MKRKLFQIPMLLVFCFQSEAQQIFQLAPPLIKYSTVFFKKTALVPLVFAQSGTSIHYTTNGAEPGANSALFKKPIRMRRQTTIKAKVFGAGFLPSETVEATFIRDGLPVRSVTAAKPDERHAGSGPRTLFDNEGGITNSDAKTWLGYRQDSMMFQVRLDRARRVRSVLLHFLQNRGSWIFLPQQILIFYRDRRDGNLKKFSEAGSSGIMASNDGITVPQVVHAKSNVRTPELLIIVKPVSQIPAGHPGSGQPSWLFIDELKVY